MHGKFTKGTWESLLYEVTDLYKGGKKTKKGKGIQRQSDEPIVAMKIETTKLY